MAPLAHSGERVNKVARLAVGPWLLASIVVPAAVYLPASPVRAGVLDATWNAPTTSADGSPVTNLASYRVYYGTSDPPCPTSSFLTVPFVTSTPAPDTPAPDAAVSAA